VLTVICAPDSFKESLSAAEVARAMAAGADAAGVDVEVIVCPVADGGEGTLDVLISALGGRTQRAAVLGPLADARDASYGIAADGCTGIVEMAQASGIMLLSHERRDPTYTTSYGTGQLIRRSIERGCTDVIVGLGGTATCDGGAGLAQAMGARFYDRGGHVIPVPLTGGMLFDVARVEPAPPIGMIRVACDVSNPLCGPTGAAAVYAPQKGASLEQVQLLDWGLRHLASLTTSDMTTPGAGAAGGAAFGLMAFCGATLEPGAELLLNAVRFAEQCRSADLVITGEGRLDSQTLNRKAVAVVAAIAHSVGVPTVAIVGETGDGAEDCEMIEKGGFLRRTVSLTERFGRDRSFRETASLISEVAREIVLEEVARRANSPT